MKKNNAKKLALSRETLFRLSHTELMQAAGGGWSDESICPSQKRVCEEKDKDKGNHP